MKTPIRSTVTRRSFLKSAAGSALAVSSLGAPAILRAANPNLPVVVTTTYDDAYQLVADRLAQLADRVVFRPFDAMALATTLRGLCPHASEKHTGVC